VQVLNTTLVLGPYDWNPEVLPLHEFEARVEAVRNTLLANRASALVIYGDTFDHGALSYLTGFTPKLNEAFAFLPCQGKPSILMSGGGAITEASKKTTWVEDVRAIGKLESDFETKFRELAAGRELKLGLWHTGRMSERAHRALQAALQPLGRLVDVQAPLERLRRRKSAMELAAIRRACSILSGVAVHLHSQFDRHRGARTLALAAEREAYSLGAQDARVLTSLHHGGPPLPIDSAADHAYDPLLVSIAVRYAGYYAVGHLTFAGNPRPVVAAAKAGVQAMIRAARPGISGDVLQQAADAAMQGAKRNKSRLAFGGIGLSLEEAPAGLTSLTLEAGDVCWFKVDAMGRSSPGDDRAISSAMVMISETGAEVLWPGV